jgi:hypothetical protein
LSGEPLAVPMVPVVELRCTLLPATVPEPLMLPVAFKDVTPVMLLLVTPAVREILPASAFKVVVAVSVSVPTLLRTLMLPVVAVIVMWFASITLPPDTVMPRLLVRLKVSCAERLVPFTVRAVVELLLMYAEPASAWADRLSVRVLRDVVAEPMLPVAAVSKTAVP